jgi:hypothetical protein
MVITRADDIDEDHDENDDDDDDDVDDDPDKDEDEDDDDEGDDDNVRSLGKWQVESWQRGDTDTVAESRQSSANNKQRHREGV